MDHDYGLATMDHRLWTIDYGLWTMDYGYDYFIKQILIRETVANPS